MNKSIFKLLACIFLCASTYITYAQQIDSTKTTPSYYKHSIGVTLTTTSGMGLSYRYQLKNGFGIQTSYLPIFETATYGEKLHVFGLCFLYNFHRSEKTNFYVYEGNSLLVYRVNKRQDYFNNNGFYQYSEQRTYYESFLNQSIGLGMEFLIQERGGFNIQLGIGGYNNFSSILPSGGFSLYYKLK